ncbi:MAG: hypothetical protein HZB67_00030 [Candidatus Aenigmarchaeota archaeon]|nr:hypothetical protein [Candidatus Aenigmarchaeota archaeon]
MKRVLFLLLIAVSIGAAYAWDGTGHNYLAKEVCNDFSECKDCMQNMIDGSTYPDHVLKDTTNHHFYNPATCIAADNYTCPTKYDGIALQKTDEWLNRSLHEEGCNKWFAIGVASHYFFDSKVIWHQVQKESSHCHSSFEEKVGDKLGKQGQWQVCECGQCINSSAFPQFIEEFESRLSSYDPALTPDRERTPTGHASAKQESNNMVLIVAIIAIIFLIIVIIWIVSRKK